MADQKWYDEGLRPKVLINWQSFEDWGIDPNWQGPFTDKEATTLAEMDPAEIREIPTVW